MRDVFKAPSEWFKQAEYDFATAEAMLKARRYIYAIFMSHLSIEKALKGIYAKKLRKDPSKTHDLIFIAEKTGLDFPEAFHHFLNDLNDVSVPTRYPDELEKLLKQYDKKRVEGIFAGTKDFLTWLKKKL